MKRSALRISLILLSSFLTGSGFLTAPCQAADPITVAPRQLWDAYHQNRDAFDERYFGKTLRITGTIGYLRAKHVLDTPPEVDLDATGASDHFIQGFGTEADEATLLELRRGQTITIEGTYNKKLYNHVVLEGIRVLPTSPGSADTQTKAKTPSIATPKDAPMGEYSVYQAASAGSFTYQYRFTLLSDGRYHQYDSDWGTYQYNPKTKRIDFRTGPMKGYKGLYYTRGRNNEDGKPVIAIDFNGKLPDLSSAENGQYQYAYFRSAGTK